MYSLIEFTDDDGLSIVNSQWLTPRKREVFWPHVKDQASFNKVVHTSEVDSETWKLYPIKKVYYECDNYEKIKDKLKRAEITSDLQTDVDEGPPKKQTRRQIIPPARYINSDSEDESLSCRLQRPPVLSREMISVRNQICNWKTLNSTPSSSRDNRSRLINLNNTPSNSACSKTDDLEVASSSSYTDRSSVTLIADESSYNSENFVSNERLLSILLQVREQNKQILAHLNKNQNAQVTPLDNTSQNFPFQLPLLTLDNLEDLETYLDNKDNEATLIMYLCRIGGRNLVTLVNNIMRKCLTNELASLFNFYGKRLNKKALAELRIKGVVIGAVQRVYTTSTEKEVESSIKIWLKHAPQRLSAERKKRTSGNGQQ